MTELEAKKLLLPCTGDTIQEVMDDRGISPKQLAEKIGTTLTNLNEILEGKTALTEDAALRLENVLNVPARFWLNLERRYQNEKLEIKRLEKLQETQKQRVSNS